MQNVLKILFVTLLVSSGVRSAFAESKIIRLRDGTTIRGRILAVDNGKYFVDSSSLGQIRLQEQDIVSMTASDEPEPPREKRPPKTNALNNPDFKAQFESIQRQLMTDPQAMADLQSLAMDPEILAIAKDPAFADAVRTQDIAAIQGSSKLQKLLNSPRIKALIQRFQDGQAGLP